MMINKNRLLTYLTTMKNALDEMKKENIKLKKECFELKKINNTMNKDIDNCVTFLEEYVGDDIVNVIVTK